MEEEGNEATNVMDTSHSTSRHKQRRKGSSPHPFVEPYTALGQFAFGPATQTTVVTTTTTTTTKFPPLLIRPPRRVQELDSRLYPLASSPTPSSLKNISFYIGGKPTIFKEAEDAAVAIEQLQEEQATLRNANGAIRTVERFRAGHDARRSESNYVFDETRTSVTERPASPESISESVAENPPVTTNLASGTAAASNRDGKAVPGHPRFRQMRYENPVTPDSHNKTTSSSSRRSGHSADVFMLPVSTLLPSPHGEQPPMFTTSRPVSPVAPIPTDPSIMIPVDERPRRLRTSMRTGSQEVTVPTPPIDSDEVNPFARPSSRRGASSIPSRLYVSDSPSAHDGSLPSPRLSPVTAAATLQSSSYYVDIDSNSDTISQNDVRNSTSAENFDESPSRTVDGSLVSIGSDYDRFQQSSRLTNFTVADIPLMLDYFEAIPDELKSYVMHQLLRRCPKHTLHIIADAVNPALRCDFLTILPPELALGIVKYLDLQSLCKAAQVSRKWRQMINGDEKTWKELFDMDGFKLPEGELQKAITEGWGWQDPYGINGYERDLSDTTIVKSESAPPSVSSISILSKNYSGNLRRSKRKATSLVSDRTKQIKRKPASRETSADIGSQDWLSQISMVDSSASMLSNSLSIDPSQSAEGLPGLRSHHMYKSLYRRHHLIRRNWLYEDTKPQHIAFRAHDTHVVTCLQFDTDKILTGSDDNNINVYDTKTGALRARLTGHEGGVWALQYEGDTLVSGSTDRSVRVWHIESRQQRQVFRGHTSTVRCLQIVSPVKVGENADGKPIMVPRYPLIITGSRDSTLRVWRLPRAEDPVFIQSENENDADDCPYFVRALTGHQHSVRAIAAHADTLVSGSYDSTVRVWKISTGETVHRLQGHTAKVYSVVLDHARNRCISGSMDNMVRIWSLDTGSLIHTLEGHTSLVGLLDLNSDRLVSAAADSTLRIWDPDSGQCKATLSAHTGAITCFQHDGQKVISGSDRTLKLWNIKTGECIKDLLSDLSGVWQVKFNERKCVAAVQRDGLTYIEVLDFGAARDGIPENKRARRIVVDAEGYETGNDDTAFLDLNGRAD